jgi:hypothetical protein
LRAPSGRKAKRHVAEATLLFKRQPESTSKIRRTRRDFLDLAGIFDH